MRNLVAIAATVLVTVAGPAHAAVFTDGTFLDANWLLTTYNNAGGTVTASQQLAGGNTGAFREVLNTSPSGNVIGVHLSVLSVYNPAISGAIASIDFSIDHICPPTGASPCGGDGQAFGIALRQGTQDFLGPLNVTGSTGGWLTTNELGHVQNAFGLVDAGTIINSSVHPDFSAAGGAITFGFYTANTTSTIRAGYDNWMVTTHEVPTGVVPEPGTLALFGFGLAAFTRLRRHKRP
jgi:PEP-CTERM motif